MIPDKVNHWIWLVLAWIGFIFFSSTSLAGQRAKQLFDYFSGMFSSQGQPEMPSYDIAYLLTDKSFHVAMFCVLAILLWQALSGISRKGWVILLLGAVVGSCSEFLQRFFPDRDPALRDVLINVGGTAVGVAVCVAFVRFQSRRRGPSERNDHSVLPPAAAPGRFSSVLDEPEDMTAPRPSDRV